MHTYKDKGERFNLYNYCPIAAGNNAVGKKLEKCIYSAMPQSHK